MEDLWAGDRSRVGVCVSVTPKDGVRYEDLQREVFDRVRWPDRDLRWHAHRRARDDGKSDDDAWVMEATASCLASSGDESQVAYRVEGVAHDVVEECEVLVSAPCHVPFMDLTLADVDISAAVARASRDEARDDGAQRVARELGGRGVRLRAQQRRALQLERRLQPVQLRAVVHEAHLRVVLRRVTGPRALWQQQRRRRGRGGGLGATGLRQAHWRRLGPCLGLGRGRGAERDDGLSSCPDYPGYPVLAAFDRKVS